MYLEKEVFSLWTWPQEILVHLPDNAEEFRTA